MKLFSEKHEADHLTRAQERVLFYVGLGFLSLVFIGAISDLWQGLRPGIYAMTFYVLLFVFGIFLIMPRMALKFIKAIPLPPFLRRENASDSQLPPRDHSRSELESHPPSPEEPTESLEERRD